MSVAAILTLLKADSAVTSIVGSGANAKISPLIKSQGVAPPAVTLQRVSVDPVNHLRGHSGLDFERIQLDVWAASYGGALALAAACRSAIQSSHLMVSEVDNYDPTVDPSLYRITQDYEVWV